MKFIATLALAAALVSSASAAKLPACAAAARTSAEALLRLHFGLDATEPTTNFSIDDKVTALAPIKALKGKGQFDVLEVWGYIYRAEYRMRFIYAQIPGECILMGQEILENSDPY